MKRPLNRFGTTIVTAFQKPAIVSASMAASNYQLDSQDVENQPQVA